MPVPDESSPSPLAEKAESLLKKRFRKLNKEYKGQRKRLSRKGIHDLRVASRRLREALTILNELTELDKIKGARNRSKAITKMAGEARNCDVLLPLVKTAAKDKSLDKTGRACASAYLEDLKKRRRKERKTLRKSLASFDAKGLKKRIRHIRNALKKGTHAGLENKAIESLLEKRLLALFQWKHQALERENHEAQHQMRIRFKKLRYALETLSFSFDKQDVRNLLKELAQYQDTLGDMHDLSVLCEEIENWLQDEDAELQAGGSRMLEYLHHQHGELHEHFASRIREADADALMQKMRSMRVSET